MPKRAKKLKHRKYTKVRVSDSGRREVYNNDTGSWLPYAAVAYMLGSSDRSVAGSCDTESFSGGGGDFGGGGASSSWDSGSGCDSSGSSDSGGSCGGGD